MELNKENIKINMMSHSFHHLSPQNPLAAFHHPLRQIRRIMADMLMDVSNSRGQFPF